MDLHAAAPAAATRPAALDAPTLCHAFQVTAAERPDEIALRNPGDQIAITWREYAERVERARLRASPALGVERGDAVAIMLLNRPEFHLVDTAALHLGAVPFSVYNTSTPEQVAHQFRNAGTRVVVCERHFLETVQAARRLVPAVEHVVQIDGADDDIMSLAELEGTGLSSFRFAETLAGGRARGPRHDHLHLGHHRAAEGRRAHPRQRDGRVRLLRGALPAHARRPRDVLPPERARRRPLEQPLVGVDHPRLLDHLGRRHAHRDLPAAERAADALGRGAADLGEAPQGARRPGHHATPTKLGEDERADLRARLGLDAAEHLGGGAAPMPIDVLRYFEALGLPISEAWGMSETAGAATGNPPERDPPRHLRHADAGRRDRARRRRRAARPRADGDARLPRQPGGDRGGVRRRRLAAHRRHRPRRRPLRLDRRPQEGADRHRGRQEHLAGQRRVAHRGGLTADRPRRRGRRPPPVTSPR